MSASVTEAAQRLLAVFDRQRTMTTAERIIVGISDTQLRREGNEAIEALRASLQSPPVAGGSIDVRPQLDAPTPEPSLRQIVFGYYRAHFAADDAEKLTAQYLAAL